MSGVEANALSQTFSGGRIPDLSQVPLYASVVFQTLDDPRLIALWCVYAIWLPHDKALGVEADLSMWATRSRLAPETVEALTTTLIERGLLTTRGIPTWDLQAASWNAMQPFSDALRKRVGLAQLGPVQVPLFQGLGGAEEPGAS